MNLPRYHEKHLREKVSVKSFEDFYIQNRMKIMVSILVLSIILAIVIQDYRQSRNERRVMLNASDHGCVLEYGETRCLNEKLSTSFHNSGDERITYVELSVPVMSGTNVYKVDELLPVNETGTLTTASCKSKKPGDIRAEWCCGEKCFETAMVKPSDDLEIKEKP